MRYSLPCFVLSLLIASVAHTADDETNEMKAAMDAFAEAFAGTWISESEVDNDIPGVAEKGDTLVAQISFTPEGGLILVEWTGEVNGKPAGSAAKGIVGWDSSRRKLRMRWFNTTASSGTSVYQHKGRRWIAQGQHLQPDGTKASSRVVYKFEGEDSFVAEVTQRKQGEKKLPDRTDTWTRKK